MGAALLIAQAQDHSYEKSSCRSMKKSCYFSKVALALDVDSDIILVSDSETGKVKYIKKSVCPFSSTVQYEDVIFNSATGVFVNQQMSQPGCLGINKENCDIECLLICADNVSGGNSQVPKT